jgi:hypothetical protein
MGKPIHESAIVLPNAINRPDALSRIAALVQPRQVAALRSWAEMGKINTKVETEKVSTPSFTLIRTPS